MQYTLTINQQKALEWELNSQQALLFAFVYECPSWCNPITTDDGVLFFALSKQKIVDELPLLTNKKDTAYRLLRALAKAGVIEMSTNGSITLVRLTDKGKTWNRKGDGSEKYPRGVGNKSEEGRKNIRGGSEKSPTNQDTSNQGTKNQDTNNPDVPGSAEDSAPGVDSLDAAFETFWQAGMRKANRKAARKAFESAAKASDKPVAEFALFLADDIARRIAAEQLGFDRMHPTTYLNGERWEDDMPPPPAQTNAKPGRAGFAQPKPAGSYQRPADNDMPQWATEGS
ncbi:hypothetical protein [Ectothiorhodospira mobilis]|uniref:hypothetical protein n=1 Tax=Ectothiorhodospira mobilis TaxID=195064 RepID=UPI00190557E1|nr:hypothetical protein [Ectothiorhodospira mobilis]